MADAHSSFHNVALLVLSGLVDDFGVLFDDIVVTEDDVAPFGEDLGTGMNDAAFTKRDIALNDCFLADDCLRLATASRHTSPCGVAPRLAP